MRSYAESIAEKYAGKEVELYIGDDTGTLMYSDYDVSQKSVIRGIVKGADNELLTMIVTVKTAVAEHTLELDLNPWCIKGIIAKQESGISIMTVFGNQEMRKVKR